MAATAVSQLPTGPGWVFEPKFDGFRAVAFCGPSGVVLQSRQQRPLTAGFPDVVAALAPLAGERVVLDGELVEWRSGRFDFPGLQDRIMADALWAADMTTGPRGEALTYDQRLSEIL